jgi:hypothetical protein
LPLPGGPNSIKLNIFTCCACEDSKYNIPALIIL